MRLEDTENDVSRMQIKRRGDEIRVEMQDEFQTAKSENGTTRDRDDNGNNVTANFSSNISRSLYRSRNIY